MDQIRKGVSHKINTNDVKAKELVKKIRRIEIKARGITQDVFSGEYHSAFKGRGMSFAEVRQYSFGDDIRSIDWNVTARYNEPFIKTFEEERELTVMIIVDFSGSDFTGTAPVSKSDYIAELVAVISFSAIFNNDKVGMILFTDKIEKFIPPKKGKSHILRLVREVLSFSPESKGTSLSTGLSYLANAIKRRCTTFIISDFMDENYNDSLKQAKAKHDLVAIKVSSNLDTALPDTDLFLLQDAETGKEMWIDLSNKKIRQAFLGIRKTQNDYFQTIMKKNGVDFLDLNTSEDYVKKFKTFFKKRGALK